jgi:hypothetical protein
MKKFILLFLIVLTSCASRNVQIDKLNIKKDSTATTEVKVITVEAKQKTDSTNIITTIDNNEITITPIDTCKEIIVEGKVYKNVILKIKKNKTNTLYTNNKKESETKRIDSAATSKVIKKEVVDSKLKTVDKKANYCWIIWLLLLILILYLLWRNRLRLLSVL